MCYFPPVVQQSRLRIWCMKNLCLAKQQNQLDMLCTFGGLFLVFLSDMACMLKHLQPLKLFRVGK